MPHSDKPRPIVHLVIVGIGPCAVLARPAELSNQLAELPVALVDLCHVHAG